jgi:hypothetical protein
VKRAEFVMDKGEARELPKFIHLVVRYVGDYKPKGWPLVLWNSWFKTRPSIFRHAIYNYYDYDYDYDYDGSMLPYPGYLTHLSAIFHVSSVT